MNFSTNDTVSYEICLSDILVNVDDENYSKFTKGYYISLIQQALEQLSLQTQFLRIERDIAMPTTLSYQIESGCFNLREIYAYSGTCCNKSTARNLWWKKDYRTRGISESYLSRINENTDDPFMPTFQSQSTTYWYGIENNTIYLSPSCAGYSRLNMVFNGILTALGNVPTIPVQLREAVVDWCTYKLLCKLVIRKPSLRTLSADARQRLYDITSGSWLQAKLFCSSMDTKSRSDLLEYLSKSNS